MSEEYSRTVNRRSTPIARKTKRHAEPGYTRPLYCYNCFAKSYERIDLTNRKLQKRVRLLHIFGARQGTLYQNQREKLDVSFGYMRDGNVTHYVQVGFHGKTRDQIKIFDISD